MFKSKRVPCLLQGFSGHGEDPDNKELKLVFGIWPIPYFLAQEIDVRLADRLFRLQPGIDVPESAAELTKASFSSIHIPMQHITFDELPDAVSGMPSVRVENAAISNLRASRTGTGENSDHRLEFDVVIPMDKTTMKLVEKYYKATTHLSMEEVQRKLEEQRDAEQEKVGASLQDAADSEEPEEVGAGSGKKRGRRGGKDAAAGKD